MVSKEKIRELIIKNKDFLEALEEFDRTGQLRKVKYKERATFTIDSDLLAELHLYCEEHNLKMSSVIENILKKELKL